jgi:sarcosine oxidase delta subunit
MARIDIVCPHCGQKLSAKFLYRSAGKLAGSVKGAAKRRSPELARKAALARWEKYQKKRTTLAETL